MQLIKDSRFQVVIDKDASSPNPQVAIINAPEWLEELRTVATAKKMWWCEPLINLSIDSEIVFEWWYENKKLSVYILGNTAEYIKVWGADIDNEMEDGLATSSAEITNLWKWLVS